MTPMKTLPLITVAIVAILSASTPAAAQTPPNDEWKVTVAPYLMGAGMSGTMGVAGQEATVDASMSDIFSNLQFGAMGVVGARKGNWGFTADFIWMALGTSNEIANFDPNQGAFSFYGVRRLNPAAELTFGMRWNVLQSQIGFKGPAGRVVKQDKQWVDPIVGLNLRSQGQGRIHGGLYADIGGFGVGSKFAWQIFPTIGIDVTKGAALELGYRWLDMNYDTGDGLTYFKYDVLTQGPIMGFKFTF